MAVFAFYPDRHSPIKDMERQCNRHMSHPLSGGVANRLPYLAMPRLHTEPGHIVAEKSKSVKLETVPAGRQVRFILYDFGASG